MASTLYFLGVESVVMAISPADCYFFILFPPTTRRTEPDRYTFNCDEPAKPATTDE